MIQPMILTNNLSTTETKISNISRADAYINHTINGNYLNHNFNIIDLNNINSTQKINQTLDHNYSIDNDDFEEEAALSK
ncbi:unnamed protein product [Trichobilharzia regenti]|nr:unnamed protein product [Trichobilharzia regenti]